MKRLFSLCLCLALASLMPLPARLAMAEQPSVIKALAEKVVTELPAGDLYWRIDNFGTLAEAKSATGPWSLLVVTAGKIWMFSLGPAGADAAAGGTKVAEVGPIPRVNANRFLLRINDDSGPHRGLTPVHSEPGSETFLVASDETADLHALVMFAVDADRP